VKHNPSDRYMVLKNARILTMNPNNDIIEGDLLINGDRIQGIGQFDTSLSNVHDLAGRIVCPGFIQTHVHFCQTLFRGMADDLELLDWLRRKIWPLEAAHSEESLYLSAMLTGMELIASGTTSVLSIETVRYTEAVCEAVKELGLRAIVCKCMMDEGDQVPAPLREKTSQSIKECMQLHRTWHNQENGRIRFGMAPRFALSCSEDLFRQLGQYAAEHNLHIHSHASENLKEVQAVFEKTGRKNIVFFRDLKLPNRQLYLAHCIWVDEEELGILRDEGIHVLHCPSSNLKLGSGIAMVPEMRRMGISVTLGADGAPCNNNLDIFTEMRTAALLQKVRQSPTAMPALEVLRMATIEAAEALGLGAETGSIEPGKKADLVVLEQHPLHVLPAPDPVSAIVYAYRAADVHSVMVDGQFLYRNHAFTRANEQSLREKIQEALPKLLKKAEKYGY